MKKNIIISVALAPFLIFFIFLQQYRLARLDATVASMESQISDLESQNSDLESQNSDLESRIDDLEQQSAYR